MGETTVCSDMTWPGVVALLLCVLFFGYLAYLIGRDDDA